MLVNRRNSIIEVWNGSRKWMIRNGYEIDAKWKRKYEKNTKKRQEKYEKTKEDQEK